MVEGARFDPLSGRRLKLGRATYVVASRQRDNERVSCYSVTDNVVRLARLPRDFVTERVKQNPGPDSSTLPPRRSS